MEDCRLKVMDLKIFDFKFSWQENNLCNTILRLHDCISSALGLLFFLTQEYMHILREKLWWQLSFQFFKILFYISLSAFVMKLIQMYTQDHTFRRFHVIIGNSSFFQSKKNRTTYPRCSQVCHCSIRLIWLMNATCWVPTSVIQREIKQMILVIGSFLMLQGHWAFFLAFLSGPEF